MGAADIVPDTAAIRAVGLTKRYDNTVAVDRLLLYVARGEFYGLLGPNGAGKTTAIHMLSTLIAPTGGEAWVAGHSILDAPVSVRAAIGVVFQDLSLDLALTVEENLRFAGMLNNMPGTLVRKRSAELLELFDLGQMRNRRAASLSGGMRRALDIARGLVHRPDVLFLDEPTIGLDVMNRLAIWRHIAMLRAELGITVVLTTHYLEEASECDRVGFIDAGRLVLEGAPSQLIEGRGRYVVEIETTRQPQRLVQALEARLGSATVEANVVSFRFDGDPAEIADLHAHPEIRALRCRRPNLNDVFLSVHRHARAPEKLAVPPLPAIVERIE